MGRSETDSAQRDRKVGTPCAVIIGAPHVLPGLRDRVKQFDEALTFTESEMSTALEVIAKRRPRVIVIDQLFALSSRGLLFIGGIKADRSLGAPELLIVSRDGRVTTLLTASAQTAEPLPRSRAVAVADLPVSPPVSPPAASPPQPDPRSTRRAPRFQVGETLDVMVDGAPAKPINLSLIGVQVVSSGVLRPRQRVRMTLADQAGVVRVFARVAWASLERFSGFSVLVYRAGMEFSDADPTAMRAFCERHGRSLISSPAGEVP